jgi:putative restriction endonuclease
MGIDIQKVSFSVKAKVIKAYLIEAKSLRQIQQDILGIEAPARGGGYVTMQILHHYMITGNKKGVLLSNSFEEEYSRASGPYKEALSIMRKYS